ncbi:hypothetical protein VZ95_10910 [Elstera litoralis]|uniref:Transcriptional regulator n=1 Tax=Elstera litoralis TaxID=552518 RepID=A0A0F3ISB6_9PROT|nr:hypothetical protein [Elstera litoralis]KJV09532.1 hypothetical protein VZ95_10910 [Elstera litoralis]
MPCLNPDGTLTEVARKLLTALDAEAIAAPSLAQHCGLPLWRVRASLRELRGQDLLEFAMAIGNEGDRPHRLTPAGAEVLALSRALDGDR